KRSCPRRPPPQPPRPRASTPSARGSPHRKTLRDPPGPRRCRFAWPPLPKGGGNNDRTRGRTPRTTTADGDALSFEFPGKVEWTATVRYAYEVLRPRGANLGRRRQESSERLRGSLRIYIGVPVQASGRSQPDGCHRPLATGGALLQRG